MPRLRNTGTGVVVSVSDATASRLGSEWVPVVVQVEKPAPRRKPKKSDDDK